MKVRELIEILEGMPIEAEAWIHDICPVEDVEAIRTVIDAPANRVVFWIKTPGGERP